MANVYGLTPNASFGMHVHEDGDISETTGKVDTGFSLLPFSLRMFLPMLQVASVT